MIPKELVHFSVRMPKHLNDYLTRRAHRDIRSKNQTLLALVKEAQASDPLEQSQDEKVNV